MTIHTHHINIHTNDMHTLCIRPPAKLTNIEKQMTDFSRQYNKSTFYQMTFKVREHIAGHGLKQLFFSRQYYLHDKNVQI